MLIYKNIITKKLILKVKDKKGFQLKKTPFLSNETLFQP